MNQNENSIRATAAMIAGNERFECFACDPPVRFETREDAADHFEEYGRPHGVLPIRGDSE